MRGRGWYMVRRNVDKPREVRLTAFTGSPQGNVDLYMISFCRVRPPARVNDVRAPEGGRCVIQNVDVSVGGCCALPQHGHGRDGEIPTVLHVRVRVREWRADRALTCGSRDTAVTVFRTALALVRRSLYDRQTVLSLAVGGGSHGLNGSLTKPDVITLIEVRWSFSDCR